MSKANNYSERIYSNRWKLSTAVVASLLLIVLFQNCGGAGSVGSVSSSTTASSLPTDPNAPPGTLPPTVVPPPVVPPVTGTPPLPLATQQSNCNSAVTTPAFNGIFLTGTATVASSAVVKSGLGTTVSGNSSSLSFDYDVNRGITNPTIFNAAENNCNSFLSIQLICEVVDSNPNNPADAPLSSTNAFDLAGNSLLPGKTSLAVAQESFIKNDCQAQIALGQTKATFKISPSTTTERCVQSNYWLKLTAQSKVAGINNSTRNSTPSYFKVTVNNGCWDETRLKDSAGNLPGVVNFGTAVAIDNNWAAVIAPTDDLSATVLDVGSLYMYMFDGTSWVQKQKIMMSDSVTGESLSSVAIRGDTMIIGSPYRNSRGMAYFYRLSGQTWTKIQQVDTPEAIANQAFGASVAINDRYIFVSSPNYSNSLPKNGAVSIYSYTSAGMTFVKTLFGAAANSAFGAALAIDNTVLVVGAPQSLGKEALAPGSVFIYDEAGGAFNLAATKSGTANSEKFGASVSVFGNHVAVGSPLSAVGVVAGFGRVTYYDNYTVAAASKTFQGGTAGENFGQSVALSSSGLYIGVPFANARAGRVDHYLYSGIVGGTLYFRNLAYNETVNSAYGYAVATSGNNVIVGARIKNDPNDNSGAAYIYKFK